MPRVSEEYYEKKKQEIVDAAFRVCSRKPVTSIVMNDVIAETGFSHGVVYRYYKDLDDIFRDLVIRINSQNQISEKLDNILSQPTKSWKKTICEVCDMLAEQMTSVGVDILKISLYSDMLALSEPERTGRIVSQLSGDGISPLIYLVEAMNKYLNELIKKESLHPVKSVDEIIEFMIVTFHGIQSGYVISESYEAAGAKGKYNPSKMFSCLAESVIGMLGGNAK